MKSLILSNKFNYFKNIDKIYRIRGSLKSRYRMIRLDKNERISNFENYFLTKIKKSLNSNFLNSYPEIEPLYNILSKKFNLDKEMFVITAGSDLAIKNCFELLVKPNDRIITIFPTYGMVDVYAKLFGAKQIKIKFNNKLELNTRFYIYPATIYIGSSRNLGSFISRKENNIC